MKNIFQAGQFERFFNRRQFIKTTGLGALGIVASTLGPFQNRLLAANTQDGNITIGFDPDLDIALTAIPEEIQIFPGHLTQVWQFKGKVLKGDSNKLVEIPKSYLGPTIRANKGDKIRIRFSNKIHDDTIIHWHGLHVPTDMDGHPRDVIPFGKTYIYEFEVKNRAGTYWYHPHPHGRTGPQVYAGLAGLFIVSDEEEKAADLPGGEYDIPLVIQDRSFDNDNQLIYTSRRHMEQMNGFLGDQVLINGIPEFTLPVATCAYRLRLLNGSNSRIYKIAWKDNRPLTVIGTDGGLIDKPVLRQYVFLSPGERVELWVDFSTNPMGYETALVALPFDAGAMGNGRRGGRMMRSRTRVNQNSYYDSGYPLLKVKVDRREKRSQTLPEKLARLDFYDEAEAQNLGYPRKFSLSMGHMRWTINGRTFQMNDVAPDEIVKLGSLELWEFHNTDRTGGMMRMMSLPHPIHLHGKQFQVLERFGVNHKGYVDEGWKDTVLLMPGESVRLLVNFADYPGLFLYHCHNLEHEDMGMMRNYYVKAS